MHLYHRFFWSVSSLQQIILFSHFLYNRNLQSNIAQDEIVLVRVAYAENIAVLAETALRFLEMVQLEQTTTQDAQADSVQDSKLQYQVFRKFGMAL